MGMGVMAIMAIMEITTINNQHRHQSTQIQVQLHQNQIPKQLMKIQKRMEDPKK